MRDKTNSGPTNGQLLERKEVSGQGGNVFRSHKYTSHKWPYMESNYGIKRRAVFAHQRKLSQVRWSRKHSKQRAVAYRARSKMPAGQTQNTVRRQRASGVDAAFVPGSPFKSQHHKHSQI